jgi:enoyl-CoA hydratase/carnithine racemase
VSRGSCREVVELQAVVDQLDADPRVQVVVFDSAVPDYFIAHYDLLKPLSDSTGLTSSRYAVPSS